MLLHFAPSEYQYLFEKSLSDVLKDDTTLKAKFKNTVPPVLNEEDIFRDKLLICIIFPRLYADAFVTETCETAGVNNADPFVISI